MVSKLKFDKSWKNEFLYAIIHLSHLYNIIKSNR